MPNHVTNILSFRGNEERIKELREFCRGKNSPFSFQSFCPMPIELEGTRSPANIVTEQELQEWNDKLAKGELKDWEKDSRPITKSQSEELIRKWGADNWYDWHIANWGTKWDCYSHIEEYDNIIFDTAWDTPIRALWELSKQYPDIEINVKFADEDFGNNVGEYTLFNGHLQTIYKPEFSKESVKLAMDIKGDKEYWLEGLLIDEVRDEDTLTEFQEWLVELAHEEGNLIEEYSIPVLEKLLGLAVDNEQYERAGKIKALIKLKLNSENLK